MKVTRITCAKEGGGRATQMSQPGSVGIILRVPLKREWYPGLKDCRVLEYDTEQQVYG